MISVPAARSAWARGLFAIVCCLLLAGPPVAGAIGTATAASTASAQSTAALAQQSGTTVALTISRAERANHVHVTVTFRGRSPDGVRIGTMDRMRVTDSGGFSRTGEYWEWNGGGTLPTFEYVVNLSKHEYADLGDGWGIVTRNAVDPGIATDGETTVELTAPNGYVADSKVLLGDSVTARTTGDHGTVTGVMPAEMTADHNLSDATRTLATITSELRVGGNRENTTMFIVPAEYQGPFGFGGGSGLVIRGDAVWDGLMTHEYVHTRQEFETSERMTWFVEGSAFYYMALVPYQRGTMDWERFRDRVRPEGIEAVLTENTSYSVAATRGTAVTAALDREIRERTNNSATLEDVYVRLNRQEGVTYPEFKDAVAAVAGESLDAWLDSYVANDAALDPPERGEYVPAAWEPRPAETTYRCRGGAWRPIEGALTAGDTTVLAHSGWGNLSANGTRLVPIEAGQSTCPVDDLRSRTTGRIEAYAVTPASDVALTVAGRYGEANTTRLSVVEPTATPTPTPTSSPTATATPGAATDTATAERDATERTKTIALDGSGVGPLGALAAIGTVALVLAARRDR